MKEGRNSQRGEDDVEAEVVRERTRKIETTSLRPTTKLSPTKFKSMMDAFRFNGEMILQMVVDCSWKNEENFRDLIV
ncbi:unnamed protein product [Cuscuta campestris]|uniref:Uncharacterized protein n=1 Tax=Cuscuta campestris TaxID=132261 RepID=A0A484MLP5_9ASTE|nr:unnamed protein product [Cuscuta campestris]